MLPRVAVDTNVLLSGILWPRWPYEVLQHAARGEIELVLPEAVIVEARSHIEQDFPEFKDHFESWLAQTKYEMAPSPEPEQEAAAVGLVRQPEDIRVALSVIAASVDYFVTYDRDFTDHAPSTVRVHAAIPGIMLPPVFLRDVMGWTSEQLETIRRRTRADLANQP
jgi:predicted nucleic acid-binding protein